MRSKTFVTRTKYKYTVLFGAVTITECRTRESVVRIPQTIKDYPVCLLYTSPSPRDRG